ncbi:hypothetical protein [Anoxynatronum sibiricum]|uniref:DUF4405 domain-containing protein n=1 Tax=Anoxynatronum sibiricum TaxID=210623 RepID=A0ABU9VYM7_9CLOT
MHIKNKILTAAILFVFSWFTPLFTILSQLMVGLARSAAAPVSSSWLFSNLMDLFVLLIAHIIFMWVMLKKFSKNNILHGIMIFALLNVLAGIFIFRNPVSTSGLFYQTANFLSNVVLSNVVFVPERDKPYMMLLPFITLAIHVLLVQGVPYLKKSERKAPKPTAENA